MNHGEEKEQEIGGKIHRLGRLWLEIDPDGVPPVAVFLTTEDGGENETSYRVATEAGDVGGEELTHQELEWLDMLFFEAKAVGGV